MRVRFAKSILDDDNCSKDIWATPYWVGFQSKSATCRWNLYSEPVSTARKARLHAQEIDLSSLWDEGDKHWSGRLQQIWKERYGEIKGWFDYAFNSTNSKEGKKKSPGEAKEATTPAKRATPTTTDDGHTKTRPPTLGEGATQLRGSISASNDSHVRTGGDIFMETIC